MSTYDSIDQMSKEDRHAFYKDMISESSLRKRFENALRIIAGYDQCLDNLLSSKEIAAEALRVRN